MSDKSSRSDWRFISLDKIGVFTNGINKNAKDFGFGTPFVNLLDVFGVSSITALPHGKVNATKDEIRRYQLLIGDTLFIRSSVKPSGVGLTAVILKPLDQTIFSGFLIRFRPHNGFICDDYLKYVFKEEGFRKRLIAKSTVSANTNINQESLKSLEIKLPPIPQQRKIARILTTLDELIEKTEALIAKYQVIKQGLMHDLFTRGVDEHGQLRPPYEEAPELYKESELGWIPKDWEVERFGDACEKVSVGIATSTTEHFRDHGVPLIRNQNILPNGLVADDLLFISPIFDEVNRSKRLREYDIVTMRTGYPGRSALVPAEMVGWQTFTTLISHVHECRYLPEFMVRQINADLCMSQIRSLQGGGAQQNLNVGWIVDMLVVCPPTNEQSSIVHRFAACEKVILDERVLLTKYRHIKSALMQDLLTGKVEVNIAVEEV